MKIFEYIADPFGKNIQIAADDEKQAYKKAFDMLTDGEKCACETLDLVDVREKQDGDTAVQAHG